MILRSANPILHNVLQRTLCPRAEVVTFVTVLCDFAISTFATSRVRLIDFNFVLGFNLQGPDLVQLPNLIRLG